MFNAEVNKVVVGLLPTPTFVKVIAVAIFESKIASIKDELLTFTEYACAQAGTETVLQQVDQNIGATWIYNYETPTTIDIGVFKSGYVPFYIRNFTLQSANANLPITQTIDRNFIN